MAARPSPGRRSCVIPGVPTALRSEFPQALRLLQTGNVAPVDLAQAAIGPGMAVYTRYAKVIDAAGKPVSVREALALINEILDEVLTEHERAATLTHGGNPERDVADAASPPNAQSNAGWRRNAPGTTRRRGEEKPPRQTRAPAVGQGQRQLTRPERRRRRPSAGDRAAATSDGRPRNGQQSSSRSDQRSSKKRKRASGRRTQSQLPVEPPHGVRRRVVVDPEVLSDRVERRATSAHLGRLGGDPLVHRGLGRIPQLKGEDVVEQGSKALRTRVRQPKSFSFSYLHKHAPADVQWRQQRK